MSLTGPGHLQEWLVEILAQAVGEGIPLEATQLWYPPRVLCFHSLCLGGPSHHPHEDGMISSNLQPRNLSHIDISQSQAWPGSPERQCLPVSTLRLLPLWIWNQSRPSPTLHFIQGEAEARIKGFFDDVSWQ